MDLINGTFEFCAALFIFNNCRVLYRDKQVRGVSIVSTAFFFLWGCWNVFYYPALEQTFSFVAGLAVCVANALWIGLMYAYRRNV